MGQKSTKIIKIMGLILVGMILGFLVASKLNLKLAGTQSSANLAGPSCPQGYQPLWYCALNGFPDGCLRVTYRCVPKQVSGDPYTD